MKNFRILDERAAEKYISKRAGETKLGEIIQLSSEGIELEKTSAKFVIFGIPEDIGVRANCGKAGTSGAWEAFLKAFLNIQANQYLNPKEILLLGAVNTSEEMEKASHIDASDPNYHEKLGDLVSKVDDKVSAVVRKIVSAGKIPIIIGGGHNNAYGNIKGASEALETAINILNIDAHTDLRSTEYRHSGNGFSYALKNGFLDRYSVFGLHENYTPQYIFDEISTGEKIRFSLFEELETVDQKKLFDEHLEFVNQKYFGLELDCDAIAGFPSSAISPTGFSLEQARQLLRKTAREKNSIYLHICEAIDSATHPTGKSLSYLVTDFIKSRS